MTQELEIPLTGDRKARIPYPMEAFDFEILINTLALWKPKLTATKPKIQPVDVVVNIDAGKPALKESKLAEAPPRAVTVEQFESEVQKRAWRIGHLASYLKTTIKELRELMKKPGCRVRIRGPGWLQLRASEVYRSTPPAAPPIQKPEPKPEAKPEAPRPAPLRRDPDGLPELEMNNRGVGPLSKRGIEIGWTLQGSFSPTDLAARLDGDRARSFAWIAQWKASGWAETVGFQLFRLTEKFGKGMAVAIASDT